ncbi:ribonucleoside triphosphate reductase [Pseudodesulfovibrio pelocollis]|uniref:ribonucleoside triphosphate reductase n=1 Tax=Pseudodesulfovibrio pelocollis TaxID=3051432 RepID=UPI00255B1A12|nr:ribonucleoside triphosphate reductase [Pseudodesulfovibrio sp. SB368]
MEPKFIIKRDGSLEKSDPVRIQNAIMRCFESCGSNTALVPTLGRLAWTKVCALGQERVGIEVVQDLVEATLMEQNIFKEAATYIKYRQKRASVRADMAIFRDTAKQIDSYLDETNWRVAENANMGHSFQGLMLNLSGTQQARYTLEKLPVEIKEAHGDGFMHIHDLSFGLAGYCAGWSLRDLLLEGFNNPGYCSSAPAKHFDAALGQMVNFLGTLQNEWAGAQAFNNVDTYLAPLVRADILKLQKELGVEPPTEFVYRRVVKQAMQKFVFNLNTTSRWGGQSPFTNLTFDLSCPNHMANEPAIIGGKYHEEWKLGDFQKEADMINKAYVEVMTEGDADGRIFSFPIPTYNVTEDFPWESEVGGMLLDLTAKYGVPYFQNFINSDLRPEDVRSMCCRLQMDIRELKKKTGGLFGAGDLTGSIGVVTLNMAKYGYLAESEEEFFELVTKHAKLAKTSLEIKRKMLNGFLGAGFYPFTKRYLKNGYKGHFSTIGLVGGHEACLNLIGKGIETREGSELMQRVLKHLRKLTEEFQAETGNMYNLEATPAEGTSYRLARIDKRQYADIIQSGNGETYYTNSTALPVGYTTNPIEALEHQNDLQTLYTGGTVFHTYVGEAASDRNALKSFIVKAMSLTKLPYISFTPTFSICPDHGYLKGEEEACPHCGSETEIWTRIVGYYRPVSRWNKGKQAEFCDRIEFEVEVA